MILPLRSRFSDANCQEFSTRYTSLAKVCTHCTTKFRISTFFVRLKIEVTGKTSRTFGRKLQPKLIYGIPLITASQVLLFSDLYKTKSGLNA
jgi:hypothetical protein